MLEQLRQADDLDAATDKPIHAMLENGAVDQKGFGNELGEMLIYAFLEGKLAAPKLMSRVELSTELAQYRSMCESIHLFSGINETGVPFNQMVFGASNIVGDIRDAVDHAFDVISRIEQHAVRAIQPNAKNNYQTAYGIFLGYSIGVNAHDHPGMDFEDLVTRKMVADIQQHARYIASKVIDNGLDEHSFYIFILPFMDAESNKSDIMSHVMKGAEML